ncbi:MAG: hypothetical protein B9S32_14830 [Verrucomicrobia bacterium Tous-C9LFEB]|nr:MAG: hypothetical protein B9S32_14830 [Verrucomicrobia bacterium Tous-C9LFEB]
MSTLLTSVDAKTNKLASESKPEAEAIRRILRSLEGLDYGSVEIVVHDGKIVQIDRRQRSRFTQPLPVPPSR